MKKILVTGSKGQLGRSIEVISKEFTDLHFTFTDFDELDITDSDAVELFLMKGTYHYVINCAAYTAVDKAEEESVQAFAINQYAVENLAKLSKRFNSFLIHISTDYVFDGSGNEPYHEEVLTNPVSVYGRSKLEGEIGILYENNHSVIIRTSWLYSEFGQNFVKTILKKGQENKVLKVVNDQVGSPTYAPDLARAIIENLESLKNSEGGIFHYANEGAISWFDFAKAIIELSGTECKVNAVGSEAYPTPAQRPHYSVLDSSRFKNTFETNIPYWRDSLKACLNLLSNE